MRITGKILSSDIDHFKNKAKVTFEVNEISTFRQIIDDLGGEDKLSIEVKQFRQRRSLDANAYAWVLLDKLSEKLRRGKTELYREYIPDVGGNSDIVCAKNIAVERICERWCKNGLGWLTECFPSKFEGYTNVILYYGSSTYDSAQMSRFLDLIIEDCKEQGIPTETPDEIAHLKALWGE